MNKRRADTLAIAALLVLAVYTQLTLFVVQPIGALPEGKTIVMLRRNQTQFIDSADAMCERAQAGVSLLCRMMASSAALEQSTILLRLPYSAALYSISTGGKTYDR